MDRAYIEQRHVIERYVRSALEPDELSAFEIYLLEHPETVEDVEYARGLHNAMLGAKDAFFAHAPVGTERSRRFWHTPQYAVAATALLSVAVLSSVYLLRRNAELMADVSRLESPITVSNEIWFERMRGEESVIIPMRHEERLLLRVAIDPLTQSPYEIEIRGVDNGFLWSESDVRADSDDTIGIVARDLAVGSYELKVISARTSRVAATHAFELVAAD